MKCRQARKMISRCVDEALGQDEKKDFDAHITGCAGCRKRLEETRALRRQFALAPRYPAPYGFAARVMANLPEKKGSRLRSLAALRPFFVRAAQVAFALVVLTTGIIMGHLLLAARSEPIEQSAVQQTFSLDLFQATPPDSIGGIYITMIRPGHEK
jgi:anti-sigma factor RsiW